MLGRIKRNEFPTRVKDLPAIVQYAISENITLHPVDLPQEQLVAGVFHDMTGSQLRMLWRWALISKIMGPLSLRSFLWLPCDATLRLASRWGVASTLAARIREMQQGESSLDEISLHISSHSRPESFLMNPSYDPQEYVNLCHTTGIDERLQDVLIRYRNDYMCHQIRRLLNTVSEGSNCAVVVGENHVNGMLDNLQKGGDSFVPDDFSLEPLRGRISDRFLLSLLLSSSSWV